MYSNHYFVEKEVKQRHKQLLEEACRLRLLQVAKLSKTNNRKRKMRPSDVYFKDLLLRFRKKNELASCECPHI